MFKSELEFQTAFIKVVRKEWMYVRNISDIGNVKKPFDAFWTYKWKWIAMEYKIVKTKKEPTEESVFKMLYPHQFVNLLDFKSWKSKWISYVIAYHMETDSIFFYDVNSNWTLKLNDVIKWWDNNKLMLKF